MALVGINVELQYEKILAFDNMIAQKSAGR